jgi:Urease alpha-subunit, N-terminal domain
MPHRISRHAYAHMFGPTVGDKVRLADTEPSSSTSANTISAARAIQSPSDQASTADPKAPASARISEGDLKDEHEGDRDQHRSVAEQAAEPISALIRTTPKMKPLLTHSPSSAVITPAASST